MSKVSKSFVVRVFTLLIGAFSSFVIATTILENFGSQGYAIYVILTSLPSLIPFADFGLGSYLFNFFVDNNKGRKTRNEVSEVFLLSCLISSLVILGSNLLIFLLSKFTKLLSGFQLQELYLGLGVISITFIGVPFSLAAKKMFAEEKISSVFLIQGMIPPISATFIYFLSAHLKASLEILVIVPSITYLFTTLLIFQLSGFFGDFVGTNLENFRDGARASLALGKWSLVVTTVTALVWQIPKYLIQFFGTSREMTNYSLMSLFLIPGLSLTSVLATWHTTNIRRRDRKANVSDMTRLSIKASRFVSIIFSVAAFLGFQLLKEMGLVTPDYRSQLIAFVALIFCSTWMIPLAAFTSAVDLKWIAIRIIPCFFLSSIVLSVLINFDYNTALIAYIIVLSSSIRHFSKLRLKNLQDFQ
jgi:hypothetical protein